MPFYLEQQSERLIKNTLSILKEIFKGQSKMSNIENPSEGFNTNKFFAAVSIQDLVRKSGNS